MERLIDISPLITPDLAVFPGDTPFARRVSLDLHKGDNLTLSSITGTCHLGAHADAPSHYSENGETIEARPLRLYYGLCQVIEVRLPRGARIQPADIDAVIQAPRVLFRTGSFDVPQRWRNDFVALSPKLVDWLAGRGVVLVGIDTPSIDLADDKALISHKAAARYDMALLEGLVLGAAPLGLATLIALPLKIAGADAAPVRAALWIAEP